MPRCGECGRESRSRRGRSRWWLELYSCDGKIESDSRHARPGFPRREGVGPGRLVGTILLGAARWFGVTCPAAKNPFFISAARVATSPLTSPMTVATVPYGKRSYDRFALLAQLAEQLTLNRFTSDSYDSSQRMPGRDTRCQTRYFQAGFCVPRTALAATITCQRLPCDATRILH